MMTRLHLREGLGGRTLLLVLAALASPAALAGQAPGADGSSREGALFLLLPVGAQGVAMGRAMTALPSPEGAFWNPAGLAWDGMGRVLVYRGEHVAGEATAFSLLLNRQGVGTAGVSYQLLDVGDQDLTDDQGQVRGSISVRSHQAVASFAAPVTDRGAAGVNFKVVQFRVGCRGECRDQTVTATTYAVDLGLQLTPFARLPMRVGAMVAHLGPRLQVDNAEQADPLPTRLRVSGAYQVLSHVQEAGDIRLWVTVEVEDRVRGTGHPSTYFGTELSAGAEDMVYVRGGYVRGELDRPDGAAVGVGLRYERLELGIARSLARPGIGGDSEPVHITLGLRF